MAHYELRISGQTDNADDMSLFALLAGQSAGPAPADINGLSAADKPQRTVRKNPKAEVGSPSDATAASPATEPPTPKVQQTAEQQKAVDPDVLAAQNGGSPTTTTQKMDAAPAAKVEEPTVIEEVEETAPAPSATAPGDVTLDSLKALLTKAMTHNAAKVLQDVIRSSANGAAGLSQAAAVDYPAIHAALLPYSEGEVKA